MVVWYVSHTCLLHARYLAERRLYWSPTRIYLQPVQTVSQALGDLPDDYIPSDGEEDDDTNLMSGKNVGRINFGGFEPKERSVYVGVVVVQPLVKTL